MPGWRDLRRFGDCIEVRMAAPIAFSPFVWAALRYGAVAAAAFYASRSQGSEPKDALHEHVLDELPEGLRGQTHRAESESALHGQGRLRRTLRLHRLGPGLEVDLSALGRMRFRRVD
jgi:hypothetical protein